MDYSHSPFLVYLVGALGVLMAVLVVGVAFFMFRRPPAAPPDAPPPSPPRRPGSGPGAPGGEDGDLG